MSKGERSLRPFGAGDDYPHPLRPLDDGEEFVNANLAYRVQKLKAETAPDHCGGRQRTLFILVQPLQTAADDQAHVIGNVDFLDLDVFVELADCIEDFPLFDEMPVHLLDEKWISLAFLKDKAHQTCGNLALA